MIVVIGCGKRKQAVPKPAGDLYTGSLFRACKRYAEKRCGGAWAILSAEHGLVLPTEWLEPYDRVQGRTGAELRDWAEKAARRYEQVFGTEACECLAGARYSWPFTEQMRARGLICVEPLGGLELGARLSWLKARYELKQAS